MRKPLHPHREGPTIVGGGSEVILTVLYDKRKRVTFWVTLIYLKLLHTALLAIASTCSLVLALGSIELIS